LRRGVAAAPLPAAEGVQAQRPRQLLGRAARRRLGRRRQGLTGLCGAWSGGPESACGGMGTTSGGRGVRRRQRRGLGRVCSRAGLRVGREDEEGHGRAIRLGLASKRRFVRGHVRRTFTVGGGRQGGVDPVGCGAQLRGRRRRIHDLEERNDHCFRAKRACLAPRSARRRESASDLADS
jgi:hypothetical protein